MTYKVQKLPPPLDLETREVLKKLNSAQRFLAELKGKSETIPNENILINTLALQEAKDSSAIENIITTHDRLYQAHLFGNLLDDPVAKEVNSYAEALKEGFKEVRRTKLITHGTILKIQRILEQNDAGYRKQPGTKLVNEATGETVYTPPQHQDEIQELMDNLISFINDDSLSSYDPLIKMALLHFQFETIHPFYDGNGRTGRILNILYLVQQDLLGLPVLYLSRYIIQRKADYYRLLQNVRDNQAWDDWVTYMLDGIEQTARQTIELIGHIKALMMDYKHRIRSMLPKIYRQELLNNLFNHPYTKIEFVMNELGVSRLTARRYLGLLVENGFLKCEKRGKSNYYINEPLYNLFKDGPSPIQAADPIKTIHLINP